MSKLSGKALADRARELNIPGRSKLPADELRTAIALAEVVDSEEFAEVVALPDEAPATEEKEVWTTVPNRADKRAHKRSRKLRNNGSPRGGFVPDAKQSDARFQASVKAGERGKFYGNRDPFAANHSAEYWQESSITEDIPAGSFTGPRTVPVNVIHTGH